MNNLNIRCARHAKQLFSISDIKSYLFSSKRSAILKTDGFKIIIVVEMNINYCVCEYEFNSNSSNAVLF